MADTAADPHVSDAAHASDNAHAAAVAHGGEHAATPFPPLDTSLFPSQLIWFALTFGLLYYVVSRHVLPSVASVLEKRAGTIKSDLDGAAQKSAAADAARAEMEKATAKARAEARAMIDAARADVTAKLTAEQEQAEARLVERIRVAELRVADARAKALADVPGIAEALAREIADKLAPAKVKEVA
ncbi:MAG: hypothetical protein K2P58_04415 [Hyphomonadaceae bacterium]|nr:hypothetical protein [Hyphomonadaceae bacterium]